MSDYSKTGQTSCLNGQRVSKNSPLIHFVGTADELNSHLGLVKALLIEKNAPKDTVRFIEEIQKNLMKLMSYVSDTANDKYAFTEKEPACLEKEIDRLSATLAKNPQFVLPGRDVTEAQIHIARTVARRAERLFTAVSEQRPLDLNAGAYLNKLSGYLFILAQIPLN
ncbi:MAG: cob(I)yrinic acid a,c-diamide adenosyltransferase [Treponema sp.]|jgi:cob(I)alamin adenosyltransferase|nr:cob(I)yrinic acid a,c-diamide adenosyltransferase [Treponema sp.]